MEQELNKNNGGRSDMRRGFEIIRYYGYHPHQRNTKWNNNYTRLSIT